MEDIVIKVEGLGKQYRLGSVGTGTLSHDLNRAWAKIRGKKDPYAQVGTENVRTKKSESDYAWALRDINFEVKRGEVLGIVGRNGAGKSTLLKILSRVTAPSEGSIKMKGRVGSLLEVGTGFHPELTGRENIYLNGAILGMKKWEISHKLDEIVFFAGVERYLDTPVKRYSSGMKVRLGFAVAAHLEPEILIVDEVLAVGDAEFQRKCMGKMNEVSQKDGRTILFVSHNLKSISTLCNRSILLKNGTVKLTGETEDVLRAYTDELNEKTESSVSWSQCKPKCDFLELNKVEVQPTQTIIGSPLCILVDFDVLETVEFNFSLQVKTIDGIVVFICPVESKNFNKGRYSLKFNIPKEYLNLMTYNFTLIISKRGALVLKLEDVVSASIQPNPNINVFKAHKGLIHPLVSYEFEGLCSNEL